MSKIQETKNYIFKHHTAYRDIVELFIINKLKGSLIHSFLDDCIEGEVERAFGMPSYEGGAYHNKISEFYVDARVRFIGRRKLEQFLIDIKSYINKRAGIYRGTN